MELEGKFDLRPCHLPSPSPGSCFVDTVDNYIRCIEVPSLRRLFQVLQSVVERKEFVARLWLPEVQGRTAERVFRAVL